MKFRSPAFNLIFLSVCLISLSVLFCGCGSAEKRKESRELTSIRFHIETNPDGTPYTTTVSVLRSTPIKVSISSASFLDERSVMEAAVTEHDGTFRIQLQFDSRGKFNLESVTQGHLGSRIAIACQFGGPRWLGAPKITRPIRDGIFTFTPDCSREEADRIVRGLNNFRKKKNRNEHFPEKPAAAKGS